NAIALAKDVFLHLWVPAPYLVAKVNTGLQQFFHGNRNQTKVSFSLIGLMYSPQLFKQPIEPRQWNRYRTYKSYWSYYRFENWNRLRAPFCPYFLRSLILGSRVTRPACLRAGRRSALNSSSARVMPCRIAPAWPAGPPPDTLMTRSNLFVVSVSCKG